MLLNQHSHFGRVSAAETPEILLIDGTRRESPGNRDETRVVDGH